MYPAARMQSGSRVHRYQAVSRGSLSNTSRSGHPRNRRRRSRRCPLARWSPRSGVSMILVSRPASRSNSRSRAPNRGERISPARKTATSASSGTGVSPETTKKNRSRHRGRPRWSPEAAASRSGRCLLSARGGRPGRHPRLLGSAPPDDSTGRRGVARPPAARPRRAAVESGQHRPPRARRTPAGRPVPDEPGGGAALRRPFAKCRRSCPRTTPSSSLPSPACEFGVAPMRSTS
jgi:hypothetical protein